MAWRVLQPVNSIFTISSKRIHYLIGGLCSVGRARRFACAFNCFINVAGALERIFELL